ncbi:MAG: integrin [Planctomycetota bacterium]
MLARNPLVAAPLGLLVAALVASSEVRAQSSTYVKAPAVDFQDFFGSSVAVSGDTLVVGVPLEDGSTWGVGGDMDDDDEPDSGAAFVYVHDGSTWVFDAYLKASNPGNSDHFGESVAISGDTIVVGAPFEDGAGPISTDFGAVYVFVRNGGVWSQQALLTPAVRGSRDEFGRAVAIDGDTIAVGAAKEDGSGVGLSGDPNDDSSNWSGAAYVFVRSGSTWTEQAYVKQSTNAPSDRFGFWVDVDGDTLVVGALGTDAPTSDEGVAEVFVRSGSNWSLQQRLVPAESDPGDAFGQRVAVDGDTIVVGALFEDGSATGVDGDATDDAAGASGAAYVFERTGSTWSQTAYLKASNTGAGDLFGSSIAVHRDFVVVGAYQDASSAAGIDGDGSDDSASQAGSVHVFVRDGSTWAPLHYLKATNPDAFDVFGYAVAFEGDRVFVGAFGEDSNATGIGGDESNDSLQGTGAVYVVDLDCWTELPGCFGNRVTIEPPPSPARVGATTSCGILAGPAANGLTANFYGVSSVDASGCGSILAPGEEVLVDLAPSLTFHSYSAVSGGLGTLAIAVPPQPNLAGVHVTFQSLFVDTATFESEFSTALEVRILP